METAEILEMTGLDKSDLSRLRIMSHSRFSVDRLVDLYQKLGYAAEISFKKIKKVS